MNVELKAKDYTIRLPDNPAKKRIEALYKEYRDKKNGGAEIDVAIFKRRKRALQIAIEN